MTEIRREMLHHSGVQLGDILFALFKRKRTIVRCAVVGIIAAAAVYFFLSACLTNHRPSCWCGMFWKEARLTRSRRRTLRPRPTT